MSIVATEEVILSSQRHIKVLLSTDMTPNSLRLPRPRHVESISELQKQVQPLPFFPARGELPGSPVTTAAPPGADPFIWIDMKRPTVSEKEEVLSWLPVHVRTTQRIVSGAAADRMEYFPTHGYIFLTLTTRHRPGSDEDPVVLHALLFDHTLITFRGGDFSGEEDVGFNATSDAMRSGSHIGVSTLFSSLVAAVLLQLQRGVPGLMIEVDQLDELILQVMPSQVDQDDILVRIKELRGRVSRYHVDMLLKERLLKQLLMPVLRDTVVCRDPHAIERYHRCLTFARSAIEKLRKGRDTVNLSSMNLVSGVSARLVQHCHWMDYVNHVQSQVALVVMPVAVIPGLWAANIRVPWEEVESLTPFACLVAVSFAFLLIGLLRPAYKFFTYKAPGALVPQ